MMFEAKRAETEPMLLTAREAANRLAISERTLFTLTKAGAIPVVRIGRAVRYDPRDLRTWIESTKLTVDPQRDP